MDFHKYSNIRTEQSDDAAGFFSLSFRESENHSRFCSCVCLSRRNADRTESEYLLDARVLQTLEMETNVMTTHIKKGSGGAADTLAENRAKTWRPPERGVILHVYIASIAAATRKQGSISHLARAREMIS